MIEDFNLWEIGDLSNPGVILAVNKYQEIDSSQLDLVGEIEVDISELTLKSESFFVVPVKLLGSLEERCKNSSVIFEAEIHLARVNDLYFAYLVSRGDELSYAKASLMLNGKPKIALYASERRVLIERGLAQTDEMKMKFYGFQGYVRAHGATILPKNPKIFPFARIIFRDYKMLARRV